MALRAFPKHAGARGSIYKFLVSTRVVGVAIQHLNPQLRLTKMLQCRLYTQSTERDRVAIPARLGPYYQAYEAGSTILVHLYSYKYASDPLKLLVPAYN